MKALAWLAGPGMCGWWTFYLLPEEIPSAVLTFALYGLLPLAGHLYLRSNRHNLEA